MKKILSVLLTVILLNNTVFAEEIPNVTASFCLNQYNQKTVRKHYNAYDICLENKNDSPILLSSDSELSFILDDGTVVKSENRRQEYRKIRKRDMGRYYWLSLPGAIIAGGITGITFFLGAPIGAAIFVGMAMPADKAVRTNVKISQDMFNKYAIPIRLEKDQQYNILVFAPKELKFKEIVVSNVSFDLKNMYELKIEAK